MGPYETIFPFFELIEPASKFLGRIVILLLLLRQDIGYSKGGANDGAHDQCTEMVESMQQCLLGYDEKMS